MAYLLIAAVVLSASQLQAGDCDCGRRCSRWSSWGQARCVYDLIRRDGCCNTCGHAFEVKCTAHPVASCHPRDCCKSSWWSRMFSRKCGCACRKKDCCCGSTYYAPATVTAPANTPDKAGPEVLPKPPVEVKPMKK